MYCSCLLVSHFFWRNHPFLNFLNLWGHTCSQLSQQWIEFSIWDWVLSLHSCFKGSEATNPRAQEQTVLGWVVQCVCRFLCLWEVRIKPQKSPFGGSKEKTKRNWVRLQCCTLAWICLLPWEFSDVWNNVFPSWSQLISTIILFRYMLQMLYLLVLFICFHFYLVLCHIWFLVYTQVYQDWNHFLSCLLCLKNLGYIRSDTQETDNKHFLSINKFINRVLLVQIFTKIIIVDRYSAS